MSSVNADRKLEVIDGGKSGMAIGGPTEPADWLSALPVHCVFLCRKRTHGLHSGPDDLSVWEIVKHWAESPSVALLYRQEDGKDVLSYRLTKLFSNLNEFVKIVYMNDPEFWKQQKEVREPTHDERNRTDQPE